jgi:hypothetical protein
LTLFAKDASKALEFLDPLQVIEDDEELIESKNETSTNSKETAESKLLASVREGLLAFEPELCEEGVNGTYFLKSKDGETIAVFKPNDEEGMGSPKRSEDDEVVNTGIIDGEGAQREVAAFLLDKDHFSGVPETLMVTLPHFQEASGENEAVTKTGSLQQFIENDGASWDIGPGVFPVHEVHKIGVLDLRIFNNDRHGGNILYKKTSDGYKLIPIDHGLSLSTTMERSWFDWISWPQAKQPFDEETKNYVAHIDVEEDSQTLKSIGVRPECIRTMKISTTLLMKGVAAGLTLYEIGTMASRTVLEEPSQLEKMLEKAQGDTPGGDENNFLNNLWRIMDEEIAMLACK